MGRQPKREDGCDVGTARTAGPQPGCTHPYNGGPESKPALTASTLDDASIPQETLVLFTMELNTHQPRIERHWGRVRVGDRGPGTPWC